MINLLIFSLVSYGLCNMLIWGSIFEKWRAFWLKFSPNFWYKLFTCFMCLGFWSGILLTNVLFSPIKQLNLVVDFDVFGLFVIPAKYIIIFFDGCLSSSVCWLINTIQEFLERGFVKGITEIKIIKDNPEIEKEMD